MTIIFRITATGLMAFLVAMSFGAAADNARENSKNPTQTDITFSSEVMNNTCVPSLSSPVVDFGNIPVANFTGKGSVGKTQTFELRFTDCGENLSSAGVLFSGPGCTDITYYGSTEIHPLSNPEAQGYSTGTGIVLYTRRSGDPGDYSYKIHCNDYSSSFMPPEEYFHASITPGMNPNYDDMYIFRAEVIQTGETPPSLGKLNATGTLIVVYM